MATMLCLPPGLISLAGSLDWIQKDLYTFEVTATDGGGQSSASNAQVTITVAGPDVSAPTFDAALYSFTVQENAVNAVVGRVQATHSDTGKCSSLLVILISFKIFKNIVEENYNINNFNVPIVLLSF